MVDVQNDFADPRGSLYVSEGEVVVPFVNRQIDEARKAGASIVFTQDWHPPTTPHFAKDGGIWPVHCVMDTWGAEFHPDLCGRRRDRQKGSNGKRWLLGLYRASSDNVRGAAPRSSSTFCERHGIERVVVVGLATDYCVKETAIDAVEYGFAVSVLADGVRGVNLEPGDDERAIEAIRAAGGTIE